MNRAVALIAVGVAATALGVTAVDAGELGRQAAPTQAAGLGETATGDAARQLVERFAPVMMLKQQEAPCDEDGEPFLPTTVDIVLDNPEIALRQLSPDNPVVMRGPSASNLAGLGQGFFVDFPGNSVEPGCIFETDFRKYQGDRPPSVYAHVVQSPDVPDLVFVQYWFYWYYNDWNNKHESDWEGIMLKFEASSVEEALASEPVAAGFAQHVGGELATWDDAKLERDGDHPVVYSASRSHASYFGSALFLGRGPSEGFGCDNTDGPSNRIEPEVVLLPDSVDDPADPLAWLSFNGTWGEHHPGSFNAPTGPAAKERFLDPAPWFADLRTSSVVIPAGDSQASSLAGMFCSIVEGGSQALITLSVSPVQVLLVITILVLLVSFFLRRTDWSPVPPTPLRRRRRAGQIVRAASVVYRRSPIVYLMFGFVYIPTAIGASLLASAASWIPFVSSLKSMAGAESGTNLVYAVLVGSVSNIAAFVVVNALVAYHLGARDGGAGVEGWRAGWETAVKVWGLRRELARAFARSFLIVAAFLITIVGAPLGLWLLVRYQFAPHVISIEGARGRQSLKRSSQLVRGRWIHTAIVVGALNGLVVVSALVISLLLLVLVTGVPLWVLSLISTLVYAFGVPLAAISMTMLYGDAVAEHAEQDAESDATVDGDVAVDVVGAG